jgi:exopolysaccharide biosynthesis WecB/TagA/CpsF family protein
MTTISRARPDAVGADGSDCPTKKDLFGVGVSVAGPQEVVDHIIDWAHEHRTAAIDFMPVHSLVTAVRDAQYREAIKRFDIVACDGQPVRWAMNRFHHAGLRERVYGPHVMQNLCVRAAAEGLPIYLYGGKPDALEQLTYRLSQRLPELKIVGAESPPFRPLTDEEHAAAARRINASGARLVFLGIGCPKQELFAHRHLDDVRAVMCCVGAAFDFHAGTLKMAPAWMQQRGLEWLYRLCKEPRRLWKRYATTNAIFLGLAARKAITGR